MINQFKKVLIIAAHPDDEVLGVGGTIAKLRNKNIPVDILICTDGSSTQYQGNREILDKKLKEGKEAVKSLKANMLESLTFPDMRLDTIPHAEINKALSEVILKGGYDTVFVQERSDINRDHKELYESTLVACRPYPGQNVKHLLSYYVNSSTEWGNLMPSENFAPNVFVDISDTIDDKLEAMSKYETELRDYPHPRSLKGIEISAKYFGGIIGVTHAEPFKLIYSKS